ncbi:MAG: rhomboid family intramembrane serine protease [Chloroflexi bacterium]|nr:rhomboid family intramembrane serine protease [Chloroflexota bacterium]
METNDRWLRIKDDLKSQIIILGGFLLILWALEIIDWLIFRGGLDSFGIRPRTVAGIWGIFFAPLLHGNFQHLATNSVPFLVLGWLILTTRQVKSFLGISLTIVVISGLGTWLIGPRNSVHLGASGLIFGYLAFLLLIGYFERSFRSIALAVVVFFLYGGLIWGVLPLVQGVSWQAHLFGFIGGGIAAYQAGNNRSEPIQIDILE